MAQPLNQGRPQSMKTVAKGSILNSPDEVLTVTEIAHYLRVKPLTIYKHAFVGKLPCFKGGVEITTEQTEDSLWIRSKIYPVSKTRNMPPE